MFIIRFLRWLLGWVEFEAEGGFPERLLNLAARGGIPLWDTGRRGVVLTARCFARKYKKLRPIARKAGVRLHVVRRHGVPFFLQRYRARAGLVAGLATPAQSVTPNPSCPREYSKPTAMLLSSSTTSSFCLSTADRRLSNRSVPIVTDFAPLCMTNPSFLGF